MVCGTRFVRYLVVAALAVLSACSGEPEVVSNAKDSVTYAAKDPQSVQFRGVRVCPAREDMAVGAFNAKNSFGAYGGFTDFIYDRGVLTVIDQKNEFTVWIVARCGI